MIEFSTTEFCLLCWAILATAKAMEYRFATNNYRKVLMHMLDDERVQEYGPKQFPLSSNMRLLIYYRLDE